MIEKKKERQTKRKQANILRKEYADWKVFGLKAGGWFPIFNGFKHSHLKTLSGNALRLYIYFGLHGKSQTGESWHDVETIAAFFEKSPRAIRLWIHELEETQLIERLQMSPNGVAFTYLRPYEHQKQLMLDDDLSTEAPAEEPTATDPFSGGGGFQFDEETALSIVRTLFGPKADAVLQNLSKKMPG